MAEKMKLPELGEGVLEGELVKWLVKEGDAFKPDQPLCEVMTDKATMEIPSHITGKVSKLLVKEGDVLHPGDLILEFEGSGTTSAADPPTTEEAPTPEKKESPKPGPTTSPTVTTAPSVETQTESSAKSPWVRSSPAVRKKAKELGVQLSQVRASGAHGRVLMSDLNGHQQPAPIQGMAGFPKPPKLESFDPSREKRVPVRGLRKAVSKAMTIAKFTAPHFTYVDELDVTKLVKLRKYAKEVGAKKNIKVTFLPFYIKAVVTALKSYPMVNASMDEETHEFVLKDYFNIGIATATPQGLMVPNIKEADKLSILELSAAITEKTTAAINGKSKLEDLKGGTFTITNIGSIGGLFATPIINYPEVAILGMYKIVKRPVINGKKIIARDMTYISMSLDHRVVDGALAAQFTNEIIQYLETPELLLLSEDL